MKSFFAAALLVASVAFPLGGCSHEETNRQASAQGAGYDTHASDRSRDEFIKHTEAKLEQWDRRLSLMKEERDSHPKGSVAYRRADERVNAVDGKLRETRDNLKALHAASRGNWTGYEDRINRDFAELKTSTTGRLAE